MCAISVSDIVPAVCGAYDSDIARILIRNQEFQLTNIEGFYETLRSELNRVCPVPSSIIFCLNHALQKAHLDNYSFHIYFINYNANNR